jgi:tetratricopeptide (TPR) repeat protein
MRALVLSTILLLATAVEARHAPGEDPAATAEEIHACVNAADYDGAVEVGEHAIRASPHDGALWRSLGEAYGAKALHAPVLSRLRWARKCRTAFENAVALAPTDVDSRIDLFLFYLEAPRVVGGSIGRARRQADEIVRLDSARGHTMLGALWARQKDFTRAESEYRCAIDESSTDEITRAEAEWRLALLYEKLGRRSDAISALKDALKLDPEHSDAKKDLKRLGG